MKFIVAGFCAAAVALAAVAATPADAAPKQKKRVATKQVVMKTAPRARITVQRRSFLDAGTEVLPGDRKFTDYAFPPSMGYPSFARENLNRPIDRQPLNPPSDMGGYPERFPLY